MGSGGAKRKQGDSGYAIVAAVASIAVFAIMALVVMSSARTAIVAGTAEVEQARAAAAADAGVAIGINALFETDVANRWSIGGRPHVLTFGDVQLTVSLEDEQGKIPINRLDDEAIDRLVLAMGYSGEQAEIARDSFLDWIDDDDEPRPFGAENSYYEPRGKRVRNGALLAPSDLANIRGFDAEHVARIAPFLTVNIGNNPFLTDHADPVAIRVMLGDRAPELASRERELAGQTTAIEFTDTSSRTGRPVTIHVEAKTARDGRAERRAIVELTGSRQRPYVVLSYD